MAQNNNIQIAQYTQVLYGGYGRGVNGVPRYPCDGKGCRTPGSNCNRVEEIDGNCGPIDGSAYWVNADDSGTTTRTYTWRDSQTGINSSSARANIEIQDEWTSSIDGNNNLIVNLKSTVTKVWRDDRYNVAGTSIPRQIAVLEGGNYPTTQAGSHVIQLLPAVNAATFENGGNPWTIGVSRQQVLVIPPQGQSGAAQPFRVKAWYAGGGMNINTSYNDYVDEMSMGTIFKNNLPNELTPPVFVRVDQVPDICNNVVDATIHFTPPNLNGAQLELYWSYEDGVWSENKKAVVPASRDAETVFYTIEDLLPTTCPPPTKVYWRARYIPTTDTLQPSDWTYGNFETVFVPPIWMTVPDITTPECNSLGKGELLDEYDHVVYYQGEKPSCKKGDC